MRLAIAVPVLIIAWGLVIRLALRWLRDASDAGARFDAAMVGPHVTDACEHEFRAEAPTGAA
jgi:hypothetical protein